MIKRHLKVPEKEFLLPDENAAFLHVYHNDSQRQFKVLSPISKVDFFKEMQKNNTYKFFMSSAANPFYLEVDHKIICLNQNDVLPINPGQCPVIKEIPEENILIIFLEKNYMSSITQLLFNKGSIVFENKVFKVNTEIKKLVDLFIKEERNKLIGYSYILNYLNIQITINLLRILHTGSKLQPNQKKVPDYQKEIQKAIDYLTKNFNHTCTLTEVAKVANMSPHHFIKVFKKTTGRTPFSYLTQIRLSEAQRLLNNENLSITEICYECGFNNLSHFTTVFKRRYGKSPSDYRKFVL